MTVNRTFAMAALSVAFLAVAPVYTRAGDASKSYTDPQPGTQAAAGQKLPDQQDCEQQDRAYVAMLACSRLLMSKDIDAATKISLFGLRGRAALVLFDFVEAAEDFSEVIKAEPDNLTARAGRAEALSQHGEHAKAAADWERIVALKPEDLAAHLQLGASLNAAAAYDKAVVAFGEAVKRDPNNPESHVGLARAYDGAGNAERADQSLAAALKINAGSVSAHIARAEIAEKRGDTKLAIESYLLALKANGMQIKPRQALQRLGVETPVPPP